MASTYSANLRLELIGTGEQQGTWGSTTNTNLGSLLEQAIGGYESITVSNVGDTTLTTANGATDQARNMTLNLVGTISAARNVICPAAEKIYIVKNATTGGFAVTFKVTGQTGVSIPNGSTAVFYVDGTDARLVSQNPVPVTLGGTGATTSTGSGSVVLATSPTLVTPNLGTPSAATLTNATGLPIVAGTTGTLSVARGGTGVTTSTGTGDVVLSTSATLTTPNLGTPSAATLTNATGLPLSTGVTGTLAVANGGTGVTTSTGSGNAVLSASPTLTGTPLISANKIDAFPAGTRILFQQTAAPTGWTKDTSQDDKALRVVSGTAGSGGSTSFTNVFTSRTPAGSIGNTTDTGAIGSTTSTGVVGSTTLSTAEMPAHSHSTGFLQNTNTATTGSANRLGGSGATVSIATDSIGSSGSHTHSLAMNAHSHTLSMNAHGHSFTGSAMDFAVQYVDVIIAQKD